MISKAQAIRNCTTDVSMKNEELIAAVKREYDLEICQRDVIDQLGSYRSRRLKGPQGRRELATATKFLRKMGSVKHAVRMVHLAASKGCMT